MKKEYQRAISKKILSKNGHFWGQCGNYVFEKKKMRKKLTKHLKNVFFKCAKRMTVSKKRVPIFYVSVNTPDRRFLQHKYICVRVFGTETGFPIFGVKNFSLRVRESSSYLVW